MTREQAIVCDDYVIRDLAVVPDVNANHEKILVTDPGRRAIRTAAVNGAMLADNIFISDLDPRFSVRGKERS